MSKMSDTHVMAGDLVAAGTAGDPGQPGRYTGAQHIGLNRSESCARTQQAGSVNPVVDRTAPWDRQRATGRTAR